MIVVLPAAGGSQGLIGLLCVVADVTAPESIASCGLVSVVVGNPSV
jgi:hypothetical protein